MVEIKIVYDTNIYQMRIIEEYMVNNRVDMNKCMEEVLKFGIDHIKEENDKVRIEAEKNKPKGISLDEMKYEILKNALPECHVLILKERCKVSNCNNGMLCPIHPHPEITYKQLIEALNMTSCDVIRDNYYKMKEGENVKKD